VTVLATARPRRAPGGAEERRWRIPHPQDVDPTGPEGSVILQEIHGELGVVLWKSLRSVLIWAETGPGYRRDLFDADASYRRHADILAFVPVEDLSLREALADLLPMMGQGDPADAELVGSACGWVASWAKALQA